MLKDFVPLNLGFQSFSRQQLIQNSSKMARELYLNGENNKVILVADGTYIYFNKSMNFSLERETYSVHKNRNIIKPMVIVTTNGTFVEIFGPHEATKNDAEMLKFIFTKNGPFQQLNSGDIWLLDRGFKDCVDFLKEKGFVPLLPFGVNRNSKQNQLLTNQDL